MTPEAVASVALLLLDHCDTARWVELSRSHRRVRCRGGPATYSEETRMSVMVILEMDGDPDALLAAAADLEARRPTSAITARVVAPTESGVVVCTVWESATERDAYQAEPEHQEALQASGLMTAVTGMRSRVFENAELSLR
jgi:hypothetical protein